MKQEIKTTQPDSKEGLHTQGEWYLKEYRSILEPFTINSNAKGTTKIATIHWGISPIYPETIEECRANAELIVKAVNERKALLDALERARDWFYVHGKKDGKIYADGVKPSCIPYIETAINNAKNI